MKKLTDRQKEILEYIKSYIAENGYPPARLDIASEFGMAANAAQCHIVALSKKGAITVATGVSRGIKVN